MSEYATDQIVESVILRPGELAGADLSGAFLDNVEFPGCYLPNVDLTKASLCGANLVHAVLKGANLSGAYLCMANIMGCDFTGANLSGADLGGAYMEGANLSNADLSGADLFRTRYDEETVWPDGFTPPSDAIKVRYRVLQVENTKQEGSVFMNTPEDVSEAVIAGEIDKVASYIDRSPDLVHSKDDDHSNRALMHHAAANGRCEVIELLLAKGADIEIQDRVGSTPLHIAAACGETRVVEQLLQNGANRNARTKLGRYAPRDLARKYDHPEVVDILRSF